MQLSSERSPFIVTAQDSEGNITRVARNLAFGKKGATFSAYFPVFEAKTVRKKTRAQPWYAHKSGKSPGQKMHLQYIYRLGELILKP